MANIKDLKKKIKSTKGTFKITSAMKLVSAAKLSKAQMAIVNSRPFANELEDTIKTISALVKDYHHPFFEEPKELKKIAILVISSNKGLCGGYNSQLGKKLKKEIDKLDSGIEAKIFYLGKKVREIVGKDLKEAKFYSEIEKEPKFDDIQRIANELSELFTATEYDEVYVAYNIFNSAISFTPTFKKVLPFSLSNKESLVEEFPFDFKYEPDASEILNALVPETYISTIYTCLLDAIASEHGSRMASMDSAVTNCKEAIRSLTLKMNKLRQAAITTELTEVVSGAESLNN